MTEKYHFGWIGHCVNKKENSNKIWGWFIYNNDPNQKNSDQKYAYAFWGGVGKTLQFLRHPNDRWAMEDLVFKKKKKYRAITEEELIELWPEIFEVLESRYLLKSLSNKLGDGEELF